MVGEKFRSYSVKGAEGSYIIVGDRITNIASRIGYQAGASDPPHPR